MLEKYKELEAYPDVLSLKDVANYVHISKDTARKACLAGEYFMTEKDLKNYKLPAHLRKKDGYWHVIIEAKHPITKEKIRHSQSTKLKVIEKTRRKSEENETEARIQLKKFQKKWSDYYFSGVRENEVENIFLPII